ncbi:unnamed protein product [Colias eurytheme]|nr:unnamed protein product [Colias eurytheme]
MWQQYFAGLLNCPAPQQRVDAPAEIQDEETVDPPTFQEVREAIYKLKNYKASGIDKIPGELWKYGGKTTQIKLFELIGKIWDLERQPKQWNTGIICPIHKKGSRRECCNYRGIALLPSAYKVLSYVLLRRLQPLAENILDPSKIGQAC